MKERCLTSVLEHHFMSCVNRLLPDIKTAIIHKIFDQYLNGFQFTLYVTWPMIQYPYQNL